jgi:hypothetical protein
MTVHRKTQCIFIHFALNMIGCTNTSVDPS